MKKNRKTGLIVLLVILFLVIGAGVVVYTQFNIEKITVTGNESGVYKDSELKTMILGSDLKQNTIVCYLENKFGSHKEIPFLTKYQVDIISPTEVEIIVYEKDIVGCVQYMGSYMYFDYDGTVVESSQTKRDDIIQVTGVVFSKIVLGEVMETETPEYFETVMNMTQLFEKYGLEEIEVLNFADDGTLNVRVGSIKVELGSGDYAEEKVSELHDILPELSGLSGTLYLNSVTTFASGDGVYYFVKSEETEEAESSN